MRSGMIMVSNLSASTELWQFLWKIEIFHIWVFLHASDLSKIKRTNFLSIDGSIFSWKTKHIYINSVIKIIPKKTMCSCDNFSSRRMLIFFYSMLKDTHFQLIFLTLLSTKILYSIDDSHWQQRDVYIIWIFLFFSIKYHRTFLV